MCTQIVCGFLGSSVSISYLSVMKYLYPICILAAAYMHFITGTVDPEWEMIHSFLTWTFTLIPLVAPHLLGDKDVVSRNLRKVGYGVVTYFGAFIIVGVVSIFCAVILAIIACMLPLFLIFGPLFFAIEEASTYGDPKPTYEGGSTTVDIKALIKSNNEGKS